MIEIQEKYDALPVCHSCKQEINTVWFQKLRGVLGKRYLYFCPHCRAVLGVSHRKGFWMG
ncbi:MAG: hypothetical protein E4H13_04455 [Calditrichales bacterium]|nr:MAG: hypothetical protein E4H13_04455 [Calditrichales bacterium]